MKEKSFILRSSRITSKTYSTITPSYTDLNDDLFLSSKKNYQLSLPSLQNSNMDLKAELQKKDKQLKSRLQKLNSNLKVLQKQYKQNLKQGFQNKIKSYRLQAVTERKLMKQAVGQTLKLSQLHEIQQRHKAAVKQKQLSEMHLSKQQQIRQSYLQKVKRSHKIQQNCNEHSISMRDHELQNKNKSLHDRIVSQEKYKDRKRNYLQYWRQQQLRKEQYDMKKHILEKIVSNTRTIKDLKDELEKAEQRWEKLLPLIGKDQTNESKIKSTLFVTI